MCMTKSRIASRLTSNRELAKAYQQTDRQLQGRAALLMWRTEIDRMLSTCRLHTTEFDIYMVFPGIANFPCLHFREENIGAGPALEILRMRAQSVIILLLEVAV
jgi:hypothetical protein